jgi:hypothetical protein
VKTGSVYVQPGATLTAPALVKTGSVYVQPGATLTAPALVTIAGHQVADAETAARRLKAIAEVATADHDALKMNKWHCGTSHCIAGWAVHLEGEAGYALEKEVAKIVGEDRKTLAAGNILLGIEASRLFFLSDDAARSALHQVLADKPALPA